MIMLTVNMLNLCAQDKYAFSNKIFNIQIMYNYHIPAGDMAKSYGNFNSVGVGGLFKTKKNWMYALEVNYLFGHELKDLNILNSMVNGGGYIATASGAPANYAVNMRGYEGFIKAGHLFAFNKYNMNCGLMVLGGIGILQHRINFQIPSTDPVPSLDENYRKGYDRLTYGLALNEFVGYYFHSRNRFINFYLGVDLVQGFNENKRAYNYDKMAYDKGAKYDYITSFRFGWLIPVYLNTKDENEFQFR